MEELSDVSGRPSEVQTFSLSNAIARLNEQQRTAVFHLNGPCLVTAVPGSGKTESLTVRFLKLLDQGVKPENILCCTFTKKAAIEMKERVLKGRKNPFLQIPYVGTMHSIFYAMLNDHPEFARYPRIAVVTRDYSRFKYIIKIAKELGDSFKNIDVGELFRIISRAKNELKNPDELRLQLCEETGLRSYPVGTGCADVWEYYVRYEEMKQAEGAIDFDDMLVKTYEMFQDYPDLLKKWQDQFKYVMIDEFQDINLAQWEIIKMLIKPQNNLFVVGDANQSIYNFRGAKPEFLYNIENEVAGTKIIQMTKNYRSGDEIIDLANRVASHTEYFMAEIEGLNKPGTVYYNNYTSEGTQAHKITDKIKQLIKKGVSPNEIGVLYRTNDCAGMMEVVMAGEDVPFRTRAGHGFFSSKIVKDFIAYLEVSVEDNCESSMSRIINVPNRYLGKNFKESWTRKMEEFAMLPKDALGLEYEYDYWSKNAKELFYHLRFLETLKGNARKAVKYIRHDIGYEKFLLQDNASLDVDQGDLLGELEYIAEQRGSVEMMLEASQRVEKNPHAEEEKAVTLSTVHGAKGLEFEHVFFISLISGIIPHRYSEIDEKMEQEERRIFFVGVTRAKEALYLSGFVERAGKKVARSIFLDECLA